MKQCETEMSQQPQPTKNMQTKVTSSRAVLGEAADGSGEGMI